VLDTRAKRPLCCTCSRRKLALGVFHCGAQNFDAIGGMGAKRNLWFYAGLINQFVDATSEQCGTAAYQSFPEALAAFSPPSGKK
jgi:hypothetical protein